MSPDLVIPVLTALLIYGERMREVATKRATIPGPRNETLTLKIFMGCGLLIIGGGLIEFFGMQRRLWWPTYFIGVIFSILSFAIRRRAIVTLGRFWSLHVEIRQNHELITSGPFRWVRHPVYLTMILEFLGLGFILNAAITTLVVMLILLPTMAVRIRIEEAALVAKFGDRYNDYIRTTPLLVPWRFPRR